MRKQREVNKILLTPSRPPSGVTKDEVMLFLLGGCICCWFIHGEYMYVVHVIMTARLSVTSSTLLTNGSMNWIYKDRV